MPETTRLGCIAAGGRARAHMTYAYELRDRDYRSGSGQQDAYREHAANPPEWIEGSDLQPEFTAIFDPSETARKQAARLCGEHGDTPALYDSFERFLDAAEYDAVIIASPNDYHLEHLLPVLERGTDVLCEKPLATTLEDHDRIIEAADSSDSCFYTGFNLRSSMLFSRLKSLIEEDRIGDPRMITGRQARWPFPPGYRYSQQRSGGTLLEKNCHDFDLFNWFADSDPIRVSAFGGQHVLTADADVDDHATVLVEYDNRVKATLEICLYSPVHRSREYDVRGSEGIIRTPDQPNTLEVITRNGHEQHTVGQGHRHEGGAEYVGHGGADFIEMSRFLRSVQGTAEPPATLLDAKKAAAVALGAERAMSNRSVVEIDGNYDLKS